MGKEVGRVPEALYPWTSPILSVGAPETHLQNQGRPRTKAIQNILFSETKTDILGKDGRRMRTLAKPLAFPAHVDYHCLLGQQGST